jgi:hypothetical protein
VGATDTQLLAGDEHWREKKLDSFTEDKKQAGSSWCFLSSLQLQFTSKEWKGGREDGGGAKTDEAVGYIVSPDIQLSFFGALLRSFLFSGSPLTGNP